MSLAPGSILQRMHLRSRLRHAGLTGGRFVEIGAGAGDLSRLLLQEGLSGCGFDLNPVACRSNRELNADHIRAGHYAVVEGDYLTSTLPGPVDVIACSMVIEHLSLGQVSQIFQRAASLLSPRGLFIVLVPGSPRHWGIEDDIAGHLRRYLLGDFPALAGAAGLVIRDLRGLTYPLSNLLLPLSNFLVRRAESYKLNLTAEQRTIASGARQVPFKTRFPGWLGACINKVTLYPFHWLQILSARNPSSLVIYCEMSLPPSSALSN